MNQRNTREAPALDRCTTCGATKLDGNGSVRPYKGWPSCKRCRVGAMQLEREGWTFDRATGRLTPPDGHPVHDWKARTAADADQLHAAIKAALDEFPALTIDPPMGGNGFVAVVMPNGYRWHVYPKHSDCTGKDQYTVQLFSPGRSMLRFYMGLGQDPDDAADTLLGLIILARVDKDTLRGLIDEHALKEAEIAMFNPDDLLKEQTDDTNPERQ